MSDNNTDEAVIADSQTSVKSPKLTKVNSLPNGIPPVLTTQAELEHAVALLKQGHGPLAVDAERASGYRYLMKNYLVQVKRDGAGIFFFDPVALPDLSLLNNAMADVEWVFHAASQDLPTLKEQNLVPNKIFDTELAGRILGLPKVNLGAMIAQFLEIELAKEFSHVDWSTRPLPSNWLVYAGLDVELLVQLRNILEKELADANKLSWAVEEFQAVLEAPAKEPRIDPWRRLSGIHTLRDVHELAIARGLWESRDRIARQRDIAPGRFLPDRAIIEAAVVKPKNIGELLKIRAFSSNQHRHRLVSWQQVISDALQLKPEDCPPLVLPKQEGPPAVRLWKDRAPEAAARLELTRELLVARAEELSIPLENLLKPATLREIAWQPAEPLTTETLTNQLLALGTRRWQVEETINLLLSGLQPQD